MAGNKEVIDLPLLTTPVGAAVYVVKTDTDYRLPVGTALGVATLGADGLVPNSQLPASITSDGSVTSVGLTVGPGLARTGATPITTSGAWVIDLSANLLLWNAIIPNSKAEAGHSHDASSVTSGTFLPIRLGSGIADLTKYLRGDNTWQLFTWAELAGKPTTFTATAHTHPISDIVSLQASLDAKAPSANPTFTGTVTITSGGTLIADAGYLRFSFPTRSLSATRDQKATADGTTWVDTPRTFIQVGDPGALAANGDLWIY